MNDLKNKFIRFMYGRYGTDQLYIALIITCFILMLVNKFVHSNILSILLWVILILTFYRTFSKDIYRRRKENNMFLKIWSPIKSNASVQIRKMKDIRTHRYRKCPHCGKVLRLPRKSGKHTVTCPVCRKDFKVRILF